MDEVTRHILQRTGQTGLLDALVSGLSASELNSLLLEVFNHRISREDAAALLRKYSANRLVQPAAVDVIREKEEQLATLRLLRDAGFGPLELSPVTQFGASSAIATVDQKKVLTALRNTEVLSDPTNAIALHYAHLKKAGRLPERLYRYSAFTRLLRTTLPDNPAFSPHFTVCALVSAGAAEGDYAFEARALLEHIAAQTAVLRNIFGQQPVRLDLLPLKGYTVNHPLFVAASRQLDIGIPVQVREPDEKQQYYKGLQFKLIIALRGETFEICDGGLVDWTQQLLSDKKERMFISGLGTQILHQFAQAEE